MQRPRLSKLIRGSFIVLTAAIIMVAAITNNNKANSSSPGFVTQQITDNYADLIDTTTLKKASNQHVNLSDNIDILSVNYLSDKRYLNATIWLAHRLYDSPPPQNGSFIRYAMLIDADFNDQTGLGGADYRLTIDWSDKTKNWTRSFEQLESPFKIMGSEASKTLEVHNYTHFFENGKRLVNLSLDLGKMLYPNKYRMIFYTEYKDNLSWLVDVTRWVNVPPPDLTISTSSNPIFLPPGKQTTVELNLNSTSGYESVVHLSSNNKTSGDIDLKFIPEYVIIPSYGIARSSLIIRASDIAERGQQISIPILARLSFPARSIVEVNESKNINHSNPTKGFEGADKVIPVDSQTQDHQSRLTVKIMTFEEELARFYSELFTPITSIITTSLTIVGGAIGYIFGKRRSG